MIEAKDTVMPGHYSPEEFTQLNKQAKVSFKAGIKEVMGILKKLNWAATEDVQQYLDKNGGGE